MNLNKYLSQIRINIFKYKDISLREDKIKLLSILEHEIFLLKDELKGGLKE